jgi:hypothetical protein
MSEFVRARSERIVVERIGDELVVYDQSADVAHCLTASVAAVWEHADGTRDVAALAAVSGLTDVEAEDALRELRAVGLLEEPAAVDGHTRREATKRLIRGGALAAAAPLIYTLAIAPSSAMASGVTCSQYGCTGVSGGEAAAIAEANSQCVALSGGSCSTCSGSASAFEVFDPNTGNIWVASGVCLS